MPVKDIIQHAIDNNPLKVQAAFDDEMKGRVRNALNAKYQEMPTDVEPEVATEVEVETEDEASAEDEVVEESVEETEEE